MLIDLQHPCVELIVGPPGTGKTTEAIRIVRGYIQAGHHLDTLSFISFTNQAINEAKGKMGVEQELKWFRTIHSLCYNLTSCDREGLITPEEMEEMQYQFGPDISRYMAAYDLARVEGRELIEIWEKMTLDKSLSRSGLFDFVEWYQELKDSTGRYDFVDMLQRYIQTPLAPVLELLVVDEAQDLTYLQWIVVKYFMKHTKRVVILGDPDQSVYDWAGATNILEQVDYTDRRVLGQSYRLPETVHSCAKAILRHRGREIEYEPREALGEVTLLTDHNSWKKLDLTKGEWLLLFRTNYQAHKARQFLYDCNLHAGDLAGSAGKNRDYILHYIQRYREMLKGGARRGPMSRGMEKLVVGGDPRILAESQVPWQMAFRELTLQQKEYYELVLSTDTNIKMGTFHSAKGTEADNVVVFGEYTGAVKRAWDRDPDPELRLLYVAITRAREHLYLSPGKGRLHYNWKELTT